MELQIKSTEYKAQDDTKVKAETPGGMAGSSEGSEEDTSDEQEIEGFLFGQLKRLNPDLSPKLDKMKQALLDEAQELAPLKVWQLQELSLQAAERILASAQHESLKVMAQLSQNFPLLARSLVRTVVRPALKEEIKRNQQVHFNFGKFVWLLFIFIIILLSQRFANDLNLQTSDTALFINGQHVNVETTDMFTLFELLRDEVKLVQGLAKIGVPSQYVSAVRIIQPPASISRPYLNFYFYFDAVAILGPESSLSSVRDRHARQCRFVRQRHRKRRGLFPLESQYYGTAPTQLPGCPAIHPTQHVQFGTRTTFL